MKKTVLHAALFAMSMPMSLYALGLGEMTVKSSLNQPFLAEIELIDAKSTAIPGIKVSVADPENFEQIGMDRAAVLSLLNFTIEKNAQGKFVIKVQSAERMTDPYMELVVDLTWPTGQLYKAYTVLLDPPGYQLTTTMAQSSATHYKKVTHYSNEPGVVDKTIVSSVQHNPVTMNDSKKKTTYGPTITNENVWQIAQRYKTSEVILPQVVLAIVGANPDAFKDGNLNGLKVGVRLAVPSTEEIMKVPADLATEEAMAHDKAWNEKTAINHVLNPPYMNGQSNTTPPVQQVPKPSVESSIPKMTLESVVTDNMHQQLISTNAAVPVTTGNQPPVQNQNQKSSEQDARMKAEISITAAAVESVRESNALLMEQLRLMQEQNKNLQQQLAKRDKDMEAMRHQMEVLMKQRVAVASQAASATSDDSSSSYLPWILLLLLAGGGGGFAYWYFKLRQKETKDPYSIDAREEQESSNELMKPVIPPAENTTEKAQMISDFAPINPSSAHEEVITSDVSTVTDEQPVATHVEDASFTEDTTSNEVSEMASTPVKKASKKKKEHEDDVEAILPEEPVAQEIIQEEVLPEEPIAEEPVVEVPAEEQPIDNTMYTEQNQRSDILESTEVIEEDKPFEMPAEIHRHPERPLSLLGTVAPEDEELNIETPENEEPVEHDMLEFEGGLLSQIQKKPDAKKEKEEDSSEDLDALDFVSSLDEPAKNKKADKDIPGEPDQFDGLSFDDSSVDEQIIELEEDQPDTGVDADLDQSITDFFAESEQDDVVPDDTIDAEETAANSDLDNPDEQLNPLKSTKALNTLLDLAKTYIGMDDFESARHSLDEVLEFGSESQKEEAKSLLDQIKDK